MNFPSQPFPSVQPGGLAPAGFSNPFLAPAPSSGLTRCAGPTGVSSPDLGLFMQNQQMMTQLLGQMVMLVMSLFQNFGQNGGNPAAGGVAPAGAAATGSGSGPSATGGGGEKVASPGRKTGNIVDVPGGRLDSSIAGNYKEMVAAAKKDGIDLQIVSSFRSRAEQEKLYAAYKNGTGNLAAKPGTSNHESGLAIDFKNTPGAFAWLKKNAGRFGLKNLPSEAWHYSTTGT